MEFIGRKFGHLTVIAFDQEGSSPHKQRWICKCDCGKEKSILRNNLTQGNVKSCGCFSTVYKKKNPPVKIPQDMTGVVSGDLTVIEMVADTHPPKCRCICKCGNEAVVDARKIRNHKTSSCGCGLHKLRNSMIGKRFGKLIVVERAENYISSVSGQTKIQYLCKCDCGSTVITTASALSQGLTRSCGCVRSVSEQRVEELLKRRGIRFKREFKFGDCKDKRPLPFDFAILDEHAMPIVLIELDGIQHYLPAFGRNVEYTQGHDKTKTEYCSKHNIPLIRIPYWNLSKVEEIVLKEIQPYVNEHQSTVA